VADGGYYQLDDLTACEDANITPYVPAKRSKTYKDGDRFGKADFTFDEEQNAFTCPGGSLLTPVARGTKKGKGWCQTNSDQSRSSQQAHFYAANNWYHSMRAALRLCL